ncbi:MAG: DJ-1/PfpI family protein [Bryobacteraceae bacterium]
MTVAAISLGSVGAEIRAQMKMPTVPPSERKKLGMIVFDGFQLLDTFGPLEMFGDLHGRVEIFIVAQKPGTVKSSAGPSVVVDHTFETVPQLDIVMIPGGGGTRREVNNAVFVKSLKDLANKTQHVASICTGAAVLAKTGLLDGKKATTNKRAYKWATSQGPGVNWVSQARWVEDGKYFTSSGISAGTDMALALIERLYGKAVVADVADGAEYEWNSDPHHDPFARLNGLVE